MTDVLYIGALGRSGSTVAALAFGALPASVTVGELRYIWQRGLGLNQLCGCGSAFRECEFWTEVGEVAYGGWSQVDIAELARTDARLARNRNMPWLLLARPTGQMGSALFTYREALAALYPAIAQVAQASLVVDSSKSPAYAAVLRGIDRMDLKLMHLVRDSRAVANARTKMVRRPEVLDAEAYMGRFSPLRSSLYWVNYNVLCEVLTVSGVPTHRLRYEDFAREPAGSIRATISALEIDVEPPSLAEFEGISTRAHTVAGNPVRLSGSDKLHFKVDDEWRATSNRRLRGTVTLVTAPLLLRYGYPLRTTPRRGTP